MKYLLDNSISYRFADMLHGLGVDCTALRRLYPEDLPDVEIFHRLRGQDVVFITSDTTQLSRQQEVRALKQAKITALFFGRFFPKMRFWDQAAWLVGHWPKIDGFAKGIAPGTCAEIKQNGKANVL